MSDAEQQLRLSMRTQETMALAARRTLALVRAGERLGPEMQARLAESAQRVFEMVTAMSSTEDPRG